MPVAPALFSETLSPAKMFDNPATEVFSGAVTVVSYGRVLMVRFVTPVGATEMFAEAEPLFDDKE